MRTTAFAAALAAAAIAATAASAETKIGTLDIERIVDLHPDTARNKEVLRETLKDYEGEMEKLKDAVAAARKAATASIEESRNPALGEKARRRAEEDAAKNVEIARDAEREYSEKRAERQRDLNEQEVRMLRVTVRQIEEHVSKYAKENGLTVVLPISGSRLGIAPAAVWADESTDITKAIMDAMGIEDKEESDEKKSEDDEK